MADLTININSKGDISKLDELIAKLTRMDEKARQAGQDVNEFSRQLNQLSVKIEAAYAALEKPSRAQTALLNKARGSISGSVSVNDVSGATSNAAGTAATEAYIQSLSRENQATVQNIIASREAAGAKAQVAAASTEEAVAAGESFVALERDALASQLLANVKRSAAMASIYTANAFKAETKEMLVNATVAREASVIMRELMTGNVSRLPGSISILAQNLGGGKMFDAMSIMRLSLAGFALFEVYRMLSEGIKHIGEAEMETGKIIDEQSKAWDDHVLRVKRAQAADYEYIKELERLKTERVSASEAESNYNSEMTRRSQIVTGMVSAQASATKSKIEASEEDPVKKAIELHQIESTTAKFKKDEADKISHSEEVAAFSKYKNSKDTVDMLQKEFDTKDKSYAKDKEDLLQWQEKKKEVDEWTKRVQSLKDNFGLTGAIGAMLGIGQGAEAMKEKKALDSKIAENRKWLAEHPLAGGSEVKTQVLVEAHDKEINDLKGRLKKASQDFDALDKPSYPGGRSAFQSELDKIRQDKEQREFLFKQEELSRLYDLLKTLTEAAKELSKDGKPVNKELLSEYQNAISGVKSQIAGYESQTSFAKPTAPRMYQVGVIRLSEEEYQEAYRQYSGGMWRQYGHTFENFLYEGYKPKKQSPKSPESQNKTDLSPMHDELEKFTTEVNSAVAKITAMLKGKTKELQRQVSSN